MAKIRKRTWKTKAGEVRTSWQLNYIDKNGGLQQKQFRTKSEADDERIRVEGQIAKGVHVADKNVRHHIIMDSLQLNISESLAHLIVDVMRRADGIASAVA